jgi:hypothetical protein
MEGNVNNKYGPAATSLELPPNSSVVHCYLSHMRRNTASEAVGADVLFIIDSCYPDEGGAKFPRNVGSYKSHTA